MSSSSAVVLFACGAAILAFWAVARFPSVGPQTLSSALMWVIAAFALQLPMPAAVGSMARSEGASTALLVVVLPSLTILFWTSGCLVRSIVTLIAPHRR